MSIQVKMIKYAQHLKNLSPLSEGLNSAQLEGMNNFMRFFPAWAHPTGLAESLSVLQKGPLKSFTSLPFRCDP